MINGIDLAPYQFYCDWPVIYNDAFAPRWAYIKTSEGNGWKSDTAERQFAGARLLRRQHEFYTGPYHFTRWDSPGAPGDDALDEAEFFFHAAGGHRSMPGDLPPAVDIEWISNKKRDPDEMAEWVTVFVRRTEELFERSPIIYTGPSFWQYCLLPDKRDISLELTAYQLWLADVNSPAGKVKRVMKGTEGTTERGMWRWNIHQYSHNGMVKGIYDKRGLPFRVDLNVFDGDMDDLRRFACA